MTLPYPSHDFTGKTVIVTGANVGLGLEAARHFVRLGAIKVILGCRSIEKGELAKKNIEETTKREGIVEVWQVDLSSYESVRQFCARAQKLERLDAVVENAGIATPNYEQVEGMESTITVNVLSTFLMALLLLPKLRVDAVKYNIVPRLTIVASDAHEQVCCLPSCFLVINMVTGQVQRTISPLRLPSPQLADQSRRPLQHLQAPRDPHNPRTSSCHGCFWKASSHFKYIDAWVLPFGVNEACSVSTEPSRSDWEVLDWENDGDGE